MSDEKAQKAQKDWRVFCAIELPAEVRGRLEDHVRRLRKEAPDVVASWSRVENIHLTLKFFGNVEVKRIQKISEAAERTVREFTAFQIGVGGTGVFPRASRPQVLWIGVSDSSGQLNALHEKFENKCAAEGFEKENRAYRPHLTIARLRRPEDMRELADTHMKMQFEPIDVEVKELVVFRSELSPKGSKYTVISTADFRG
jgi:RNA 2',3'-cyclic 3'-phosphodiesterase